MKKLFVLMALAATTVCQAQDLTLNDREYFERQGVNVLVFSNSFNGGFNDEKNSGIEIIHHGVRTVQGGAVRLNNTPEQWDLVPKMTDRKVDRENELLREFAKELGSQLIYFVPRDNEVQRAEIKKKTVIDHDPNHPQAQEYRNLALAIENNTQFVIPKPMTQERLEEILIEFGLMDSIKDNYHI